MAAILESAVGKPAEDDSADTGACLYPPADAESRQQANVEIQWQHGVDLTPTEELAQLVGGEAGEAVAHNSKLGDESTYSLDGTLRIRTGNSLITIEVPVRQDSEDKAVAIARLLLMRLGVPDKAAAAPQTNVAAAKTQPTATPKIPDGLQVGQECLPVDNPHLEESAIVPLKAGLTLSNIWNGGDDNYDHEMILQVAAVTDAYIDITQSSPRGADHHNVYTKRRICRASLRDAYFYRTESGLNEPPVLSPATMFSLSARSLRELKTTQSTRHRYIEFDEKWDKLAQPMDRDLDMVLRSGPFDRETYVVDVNGSQVKLPVITTIGAPNKSWQTSGKILDDERFPLMLEYQIPGYGLKIRYTKITYPADDIEKQLIADKHVIVYGIFFDFASDRLRPESTPILQEIASLMKRHSEWKITVTGHTDNVGGDSSNLQLSRKRAKSVTTALIDQYGIAENRLTSGGYGASQPQEKNDTPEGRARNRRVELTLQ